MTPWLTRAAAGLLRRRGRVAAPETAASLRPLVERAEAGDAAAAFEIGWCHEAGKGVLPCAADARAWYERAAAQGHVEAMARLAVLHVEALAAPSDRSSGAEFLFPAGRAVQGDGEIARAWAALAAAGGSSQGASILGYVLAAGIGGPVDRDAAFAMYERAAEAGHAEAQLGLGLMLAETGSPDDRDRALDVLQRAATSGNRTAAFHLGQLLADRHDEAVRAFEQATQAGHAGATRMLARHLRSGLGVAPDPDRADRLLRDLASAGDVAAMLDLADAAMSEADRPERAAEAASWYRRAAEAGNPRAAHAVAVLHLNGHGAPRDPVSARHWLEPVAEAGDPNAQLRLGCLLVEDEDPSLRERGIDWLRRAADGGSADAAWRLGVALLESRPEDRDEALRHLRRAAGSGHADAAFRMGIEHALGRITPADPKRAAQWLEMAARLGHGGAQINLARFLMRGLGCERDVPTALSWLDRAGKELPAPALTACAELLAFWSEPPRPDAAIPLLRRAARGGDPRAASILRDLGAPEAVGTPSTER